MNAMISFSYELTNHNRTYIIRIICLLNEWVNRMKFSKTCKSKKTSVSYIYILMTLFLMISVTGCMKSGSSDDDTIRIAMVPKIIGISYFDKCAEGAKAIADKYQMEFIYKGPTTADAASQVNIIQDLIYNDIDVLAVAPIDPDAVEPILIQARKMGITVVTFDADATAEGREIFVSQVEGEALGEHIVDNIVKLIGDEGRYAILTASLTADNQNQWLKAMESYQSITYPNLDLITVIPTDEDQQKAYVNTRNLIQAYPKMDLIFAMSTEAGPGAAQAFKSLGIKGDVKLYGLSLPEDMQSYINEDYAQLATLWSPYDLGALTVEIIHELLENGSVKNGDVLGDFGPLSYNVEKGIVIMGEPLDFDKENINQVDF